MLYLLNNFNCLPTCRRNATAKKKEVRPSPATAPHTLASGCPALASRKSGEHQTPPEQDVPEGPNAPTPEGPAPSKPLTISDDTPKETDAGGNMGGAEVES